MILTSDFDNEVDAELGQLRCTQCGRTPLEAAKGDCLQVLLGGAFHIRDHHTFSCAREILTEILQRFAPNRRDR